MLQPTCDQIIVHQSRFRKRHLDLIPKYFVEIVRKAYEIGVSDFKEISIDGTKLPAVNSRKKSMPTGLLDYRIKIISEDIDKYIQATEEDIVPEKLEKEQKKLQEAKTVLESRKLTIKNGVSSNSSSQYRRTRSGDANLR